MVVFVDCIVWHIVYSVTVKCISFPNFRSICVYIWQIVYILCTYIYDIQRENGFSSPDRNMLYNKLNKKTY